MDLSVFDALLDGVIVLSEDKKVVYANDAAATLCDSSVRRMSKSQPISSFITFENKDLFISPEGTLGKEAPLPVTEVAFETAKGKKGFVQVTTKKYHDSSQDKDFWVTTFRDTTLEEVLHRKYRIQLEQKEDVIDQLEKARAELEDYSKNLESMVSERTAELQVANRMLSAIMDSLGQGFLVFDSSGDCSSIYTKACETILEGSPEGRKIWEVLGIQGSEADQLKSWVGVAFAESLPFESLSNLAPAQYFHSQGRYISLDYYPIRDSEGGIANIVLVATDKTNERQALLALEREKSHAKMIMRLVTNRKQFTQFLKGTERSVTDLFKMCSEQGPENIDISEAFRVLHTLEGEAGAFSVLPLRSAARLSQEIIEPFKDGSTGLSKEAFESFFQSLEDLHSVYTRHLEDNSKLYSVLKVAEAGVVEVPIDQFHSVMDTLEASGATVQVLDVLRESFLLEPFSKGLQHFDDIVQMVARKQGKKVATLEVVGDGPKVYLEAYEKLFSSLVHVFRNSVDHGIECPEDREFSGKPQQGTIQIMVGSPEGRDPDSFELLVQDDGQGIDPQRIREKLGAECEQMTDVEVIQHIFDPGLTSRSEIGEFSGRGVGMDAVKTEVERLGGEVKVISELGVGTKICFRLPVFKKNFDQVSLAA